jgi:hypothetical protein
MIRLESKVTVAPEAALKVAVASKPVATMFDCQLAASLQFPSTSEVHVPLAPAITSEPVPVKYDP